MLRLETSHKLGISAAKYWSLSQDEKFRNHASELDGNRLTTLNFTSNEVQGKSYVTRVSKITARQNPVPVAIRRIGGLGDEFFFVITESFWPETTDREHRLTFSTEPPVLANRISVTGSHWAEDKGDGTCTLNWELHISARIVGVGQTIAKGIQTGTVEAYSKVPGRVMDYLDAVAKQGDQGLLKLTRSHVARRRWQGALCAVIFILQHYSAPSPVGEEEAARPSFNEPSEQADDSRDPSPSPSVEENSMATQLGLRPAYRPPPTITEHTGARCALCPALALAMASVSATGACCSCSNRCLYSTRRRLLISVYLSCQIDRQAAQGAGDESNGLYAGRRVKCPRCERGAC